MADLATYEQRINELQDLINALEGYRIKAADEVVTLGIVNSPEGFSISDGSQSSTVSLTTDSKAALVAMTEASIDAALTEAKTRANTFNYSV